MTYPRPFTRIQREVLVENAWHRYCRDRYVQADGSEGTYFYVDMTGSAAAIAVHDDHTVVLLRVARYLLDRELWEFPIGGVAPGGEPLQVARTELREEGGVAAREWIPLGRFAPYKGVSNEVCHFFLARGLTAVGQDLEPSERISVHRMPLEEARRLIVDQEVGDGQSMAGLMLLDRWLAAGNRL